MVFTSGHVKTGGRRRGIPNRRTIASGEKTYPDALEYLATTMKAKDGTVTPDLKLRAAIALAQYQRPKPAAPARDGTFIAPIEYTAPKTPDEARVAILDLGARVAKGEIPVELHDALINELKAYLGDRAAEQQKRLDELEEALRGGDAT